MTTSTRLTPCRIYVLPPIPWVPVPITPLPEVIESNSEAAWELFDAAQRAYDREPCALRVNQFPE